VGGLLFGERVSYWPLFVNVENHSMMNTASLSVQPGIRIVGGKHGWRVDEASSSDGVSGWKCVSWHASLEEATISVARTVYSRSNCGSEPEALQLVQRVIREARAALCAHIEGWA